MSLSSTTLQPVQQPSPNKQVGNDVAAASLLSMLVLSVYAAQKSKKSFRKMKRKFMWEAFKLKTKSMFSKKAGSVSNRTLLYIILGVVLLALLFIEPVLALVLALLVLILILVGAV
ncbi:MAG TPA: hypothetical protein VNS32_26470 [Flavisolibacter sp.]|nr:hypothetical protein [Flavisolibacter sp.]